jgi:hypothetical protein
MPCPDQGGVISLGCAIPGAYGLTTGEGAKAAFKMRKPMATEQVLVQAMGIESGCIYHLLLPGDCIASGTYPNKFGYLRHCPTEGIFRGVFLG